MITAPMFRSRLSGDEHLHLSDIGVALGVAFALPLAAAFTLGRLPWLEILTLFGLSSFFAVFALPAGALIALRAMRQGWAGWGIALLAGAGASYLVIMAIILLDDGPIALPRPSAHLAALSLAPVGMIYASLMWITIYVRRPEALIAAQGADL